MSSGSLETSKNSNVFDVFYEMLKQIKDSNKHNDSSKMVVRDGQFIEDLLAKVETKRIPFSGEERLGRYLDLHELYNRYTNSKFGHCFSYTDYLGEFPGLDNENMVPSKFKATREYKAYVKDVLEYLVSFMDRARPLTFLDRVFKDLEQEFTGTRGKKRARPEIDTLIDDATTVYDLMELGLDKLKEALQTLGLKSGGTLRQRAERLLLAKNTPVHKLDERHLMKEDGEKTSLLEAKVKKLCEILSDTLEQTRQHVQNKQAMSVPERQKDFEDYENDNNDVCVECDEDSDETGIKNPLKLPMGWDGKPIPYWLYKLHGLNLEFKCEICGDHTYIGRRAFETHFNQSRHQHGMRCLGIPNTKSFNEITSIQDAKNLWHEIQLRQGFNKWRPDVDEEFEDGDGNVYDKKTYSYLVRQGLI